MAGEATFQNLSAATCGVAGVSEIRGDQNAQDMSFGIVVSRFHIELTTQLCRDAVSVLIRNGAAAERIQVVWVPGAFEIPSVIRPLAQSKRHDALISLGAVVRGETSHADSIVHAVTVALGDIARECAVPVIDTVVAAPSYALAEERCRSGPQSRGTYAGGAAIEMASVFRRLAAAGGA
jgi:6,7-dimethyl-8-ribityllumazine synthase